MKKKMRENVPFFVVTFRIRVCFRPLIPVMAFSVIMRSLFFSAQCSRPQSSLWLRKSPVSTVNVCMARRCLGTHHARSFAAAARKTASSEHINSIYADDLPIISQDTGKVAIGWDTRTWSRLYVSSFYLLT